MSLRSAAMSVLAAISVVVWQGQGEEDPRKAATKSSFEAFEKNQRQYRALGSKLDNARFSIMKLYDVDKAEWRSDHARKVDRVLRDAQESLRELDERLDDTMHDWRLLRRMSCETDRRVVWGFMQWRVIFHELPLDVLPYLLTEVDLTEKGVDLQKVLVEAAAFAGYADDPLKVVQDVCHSLRQLSDRTHAVIEAGEEGVPLWLLD